MLISNRRLLLVIVTLSTLLPVLARADEYDDLDGLRSKVDWGLGVQVRRSNVPTALQEVFVEDSPGPATFDGASLEFARRNKELEFIFSFGYDPLNGKDGYYVEKGGVATTAGKVDYYEFHKLKWFTAEASFIGDLRIHKLLALRYGAGLGVGLVRGKVLKTDALCTGTDAQNDCMLDPMAVDDHTPADVPPVLPVVNVLVGMQLRPFDALVVNLDVGMHSVPYVSGSVTLYLW